MQGIAVLPQGLELLGAEELSVLGATVVRPLKRAVAFQADMACLYRLYIKARLPFRLLRQMAIFECNGPDSLYKGVQDSINWKEWLHPSRTFRVDISGSSQHLPHSHFTALQVKNALVDIQRAIWGFRSDISLNNPDLCIHLHLNSDEALLSFDGSGGSLHRRGYRAAIGRAPLKENLAAGLIGLTGWNQSAPLIDPLCGSGTFLIEAISMALDAVPSLHRSFCIEGWADFDEDLWEFEKELAISKRKKNKLVHPLIGFEQDSDVAYQARKNVRDAGFQDFIEIKNSHYKYLKFPETQGLIITNPPYGKRIGSENELFSLYDELGSFVKRNASGWDFWLLSGNPNLTRSLKMKARKRHVINNGGIDCRWLNYSIY